VSGVNPSYQSNGVAWLSEGWYGLDQGLLVMMIENYRSDLVWNLTRDSALFQTGLRRAGFAGGWLG
jgi:hypothetical protein